MEAGQTSYYYVRDAVLMVTGQEDMLRRAARGAGTAPADAEPELAGRLRDVGADRAALALWVNPRAFDAGMEAKAAQGRGGGRGPLQKKVLAWWKATDGGGRPG